MSDSGFVVGPVGGARVRLWQEAGLVAGTEAGRGAPGCPLLEAPAGSYSVTVGPSLGPYPVDLRRGHIDTLIVRYRINLGPVGPATDPPGV